MRDVQLNTKFDIDALQATTADHGQKIDRLIEEVAQLQLDTTHIAHTKTDLSIYEKEVERLD